MKFDHIALGVQNLDVTINMFVETLGHRLIRTGVQYKTGRRIALLADPTRQSKVELIETDTPQTELLHVAYEVSDVESEYARLLGQGYVGVNPPHPLSAAKAYTALLSGENDLKVQIIQYDQDSPDVLNDPES